MSTNRVRWLAIVLVWRRSRRHCVAAWRACRCCFGPTEIYPQITPHFVAINRLAARGVLPQSRREVDFMPDAEATAEWQAMVLKLCGDYEVSLAVAEKLTRGEFAQKLWSAIKGQAAPAW
jgi:hypothetical protein